MNVEYFRAIFEHLLCDESFLALCKSFMFFILMLILVYFYLLE